MNGAQGEVPLVGYGSGVVGIDDLNKTVAEVWHEVLKDPEAKQQAALILAISTEDLQRMFPASPVEIKPNESGLGPLETAIIVFLGTVAYDLAKDVAKSGAKKMFLVLWQKVIKPRVEKHLPLGAFGKEADLDES